MMYLRKEDSFQLPCIKDSVCMLCSYTKIEVSVYAFLNCGKRFVITVPSGMMALYDVPKPAWRAFELLHHSGDRRHEPFTSLLL